MQGRQSPTPGRSTPGALSRGEAPHSLVLAASPTTGGGIAMGPARRVRSSRCWGVRGWAVATLSENVHSSLVHVNATAEVADPVAVAARLQGCHVSLPQGGEAPALVAAALLQNVEPSLVQGGEVAGPVAAAAHLQHVQSTLVSADRLRRVGMMRPLRRLDSLRPLCK